MNRSFDCAPLPGEELGHEEPQARTSNFQIGDAYLEDLEFNEIDVSRPQVDCKGPTTSV